MLSVSPGRRLYLVGVLASALGGCASIDSLQPGQGSSFEVHDRDYDLIWQAAVTALSRQLVIVQMDKQTGTLKAERPAGLATWGEVVGVFIRRPSGGSGPHVVEVQSAKRMRTQITGQDWTLTVISAMKAELKLL